MDVNGQLMLCPFFGKCDGVVVIDPDLDGMEYRELGLHVPDAMCDLIVGIGVHRLIVGFVGEATGDRLRALGIDVRLGPCACAVDELVKSFDRLPAA